MYPFPFSIKNPKKSPFNLNFNTKLIHNQLKSLNQKTDL